MLAAAQWNPDEWQQWVNELLALRYGPDQFQIVPDEHRGDFGIEGYSLDGCAFQSYCPERHGTIKELYDNQRRKISKDLRKFVRNAQDLQKLFGDTKISCWILVVPEHVSSRLCQFAQQKAQEIRAKCLPYVAPNFHVNIATEDYFAAEAQLLRNRSLGQIRSSAVSPADLAVDDWQRVHDPYVAAMTEKLGKAGVPDADKQSACRELTKLFLQGENEMEAIRARHPLIFEKIVQVKKHRTDLLPAACTLEGLTVLAARAEFTKELQEGVPAIHASVAEVLAYAAVSEWLMTCPLTPRRSG